MNEQNKKQIIFAVVLLVLLGGVIFYQFGVKGFVPVTEESNATGEQGAGKEKAVAAKAEEGKPAPVAPAPAEISLEDVDIEGLIASVEVVPVDYSESRIARNPMTPLVGAMPPGLTPEVGDETATEVMVQVNKDTTASKVISGIIWDKQFPVAVVDDVVVHPGYVFPNGAQVHEIEPTRVLFKVGDTLIPVEMKEF